MAVVASTLPEGNGLPEANLPENAASSSHQEETLTTAGGSGSHFSSSLSTKKSTSFADVVTSSSQKQQERRVSFGDRLKKIRETRNMKRSTSSSSSSPPTGQPSHTGAILSTVPEIEHPSPSLATVTRGEESFGVFSSDVKLSPSLASPIEEKPVVDSVQVLHDRPQTPPLSVAATPTLSVPLSPTVLEDVPQTPPLLAKAPPTLPALPPPSQIPQPIEDAPQTPPLLAKAPPTLPALPPPSQLPSLPLVDAPKTPPLSATAPPTLPSSPPPSQLPLSPLEDDSLSPTLFPGDVQLSSITTSTSDELATPSSPPTGHQHRSVSTDALQDAYPGDYNERRRSFLVGNAFSQDLQFKPTLKKWDVVNLNDESNGFATPPADKFEVGVATDIGRARSSSGLSRISGGNIEHSLESISETTPPTLPRLIQERLLTGNLQDDAVTVRQVAKTSWQPLLNDELVTTSACELTTPNPSEIEPVTLPTPAINQEKLIVHRPKKPLQNMDDKQKLLLDMGEEGGGGGNDECEGNLNRLNQDIPKSISSLLDAVVSDIPELANSSDEEEKDPGTIASKEPVNATPVKIVAPKVSSPQRTLPVQDSTQTKQPVREVSVSPPWSGEHQIMMKIHMQSVHPGVMYKMFRVTDSTTCTDLVTMALKKANLIEDPRSYALYKIHNTTKGILKVLTEKDRPYSFLSSSSTASAPPSHWEMRRRMDNTKLINVDIELSGISTKSLSLNISDLTTSKEVIGIISRKLGVGMEGDVEMKFRILSETNKDERLMGCDSPLLHNRSTGHNRFKLVDIVQYLTRDQQSHAGAPLPVPKDLETAKVILQQNNQQLLKLENDLVVRQYTIEQSAKDLQEARDQYSELMTQKKSLERQIETYQEKQRISNQSLEELHGLISQLTAENKNKSDELTFLKTENEKVKGELEKKEVTVMSLQSAVDELKTLSSKHREETETLSRERASLVRQLDELQIQAVKTVPGAEETDTTRATAPANDDVITRKPLYSLFDGRVQNVILTVELLPTTAGGGGLGLMLVNSPEEGQGCLVKAIASSSNAHGILLPGDMLLEINGVDVSDCSHQEIVGLLNGNSGAVQLVACRRMDQSERDRTPSSEEADVTAEQTGQETDHWKEECTKLTQQLQEINSLFSEQELLLLEKDRDIEEIRSENQQLKENQIKDIESLKMQLLGSDQTSPSSPTDESLADTLKDASHEELLDALRTVESDCLKNKESLDNLFALIVGHTPDLLSLMAEVQQPDGESDVEENDTY